MANRKTLRVVVAEGMSRDISCGIKRDTPVAHAPHRASVIIGPRRCGVAATLPSSLPSAKERPEELPPTTFTGDHAFRALVDKFSEKCPPEHEMRAEMSAKRRNAWA